MESLNITKQTLKEFIDAPFGFPNKSKNLKYEDRYQSYKKNNKIKVESSIEYMDNYFIHIRVPSESQHGDSYYDVVIQFMPKSEKSKMELTVNNYLVQFFSNSPGFVYKYAALYKLHGYLIESLYNKFDEGMLDILPDKANSSYELYFDSSIYYASRYLLDTKVFSLGKLNLKMIKTKTPEVFFQDIQDTESVKLSHDVSALKISVTREINKDKKLSEKQTKEIQKRNPDIYKEVIEKKRKISAKNKIGRTGRKLKIISRRSTKK